ncbi:cation diffusion facilitator family transporter [Jiangella rhizosphaerae]|uniref:cation diffusion facilitator family transporter n=1 Tax=Jiangella rhizosphaerae TaxID=2293569 RepID=UPI0018F4F2A7|nr:cation diffusion facilitator family transporter [Jiangella rhizosphaerae]
MIESAEEASGAGIRAAWIGLAGMMATAALQLVIVAVSGSVGLLADTVHNLGHAITTIPLLIAFRLGRRAPTRRYPYGFRRAEDLSGVLIALVIAASAALIIVEAVRALIEPRELTNLGWVLAAALIGAAGNEAVAVYRIRIGRRIGSAALVAEGHHARADGLTSLVVVVGVAGAWLGFPRADAVVGLVVGAAILWILVTSARTIFRRLMDGVDDGTVEAIESVAAGVDGVHGVGRVRARWTGHRLEADVDVNVDGAATVAEGHRIAEIVHHALLHRVRHLGHVVVHVNPAYDGVVPDDVHELTAHHAAR